MEHKEKEEWCGPECSKAHIHGGELFPADIRASQPPRKGDDLTAGLKREAAKIEPMTLPPTKENWRERFEKLELGFLDWCGNENHDCECSVKTEKILAFIENVEMTAVERTEKAFGGCKNCYGKGYATVLDHSGNARIGYWKNEKVRTCDCERGKQLAEVLREIKGTH